jgi:GAF domain-containing protein
MLFCPPGLGSNTIRDQRNGPRGDDVWAGFVLDRPPSLNAEIAQGRWQALNLLLQSLVFLHVESKGRSPLVSALQSACVIGAAKRGLLYLQEEGSLRLELATTVGFGGNVPDAIRDSNVMAAAAIRRSKPIVVNIPRDAAVQDELELLAAPRCLSVPILRRGRPWGAIQLLRDVQFGEDEAIVLWMYALILEGILPILFESATPAETPATSGSEPGLVDLDHFETRLRWEIERSGWLERPMSFARLTWVSKGAVATPAEVQRFSPSSLRALRRIIRPSDLIASRADNELLIVMADRSASEARKILGQIRRSVGREGGNSPGTRRLDVVAVSYPQDGRQVGELFRALDARAGTPAVATIWPDWPISSI